MKGGIVRVLDEKDFEFVKTLTSLGVHRTAASMITYLANVDEAIPREIESGTDLRQPEVKKAARALCEMNWVTEQVIKRGKGGGQIRIYALNTSIAEIIRELEEKMSQESVKAMENIEKLKKMASS